MVEGEKASEDLYVLSLQSGGGESLTPKAVNDGHSRVTLKKSRISAEDAKNSSPRHMNDNKDRVDSRDTKSASSLASRSSSPEVTSPEAIDSHNKPVSSAANCPCVICFPEPEVHVLPCGRFSPVSSIFLPLFTRLDYQTHLHFISLRI